MQIITASDDGTVKVWDWVEGRLVRTLPFAIGGRVYQIAIGQVVGKWVVFANAGLPKENHDSSKQGELFIDHQRTTADIRLWLLSELSGASSRPYAYHGR